MRIGAHADAANGTHSVSPSVSLSLPLISKTARELSHTLQVAGSEGRWEDQGRLATLLPRS